jgi:hypothetical protein
MPDVDREDHGRRTQGTALMGGGFCDLILLELPVESGPAYSQPFSCLFFIPAAPLQNLLKKSPLVVYEGRFLTPPKGDAVTEHGWEIRAFYFSTLGEHGGVFNTVLKFSNIAGPGIVEQQSHCFGAKFFYFLALRASESMEKMTSKERDIIAPIPERWQNYGDHVETVIEIFTKIPNLHLLKEVLVGGGKYPYING